MEPDFEIFCHVKAEHANDIAEVFEHFGALSVSFEPWQAPHVTKPQNMILEPEIGTMPLWQDLKMTGHFEKASCPVESVLEALHQDPRIYSVETAPLPEKDWVKETQIFEPLHFSHFAIRPLEERKIPILYFQPGAGFGTGKHPTTYTCLSVMDELGGAFFKHKRVLDFGSGSGILGLVALLMGAEHVWAVDHDPQARVATQENAARNQMAHQITDLSSLEDASEPVDCILANILAEPLKMQAEALLKRLKPDGVMILSGMLSPQLEEVMAAYQNMRTDFMDFWRVKHHEGWGALILDLRQKNNI